MLRWYRTHHRKLPWRETSDPYKIWVSEIMLQQTTVSAVIPHYLKWLRLFPDIQSLATAPLRKVLKAWQGLGYYARAKNLRETSKVILKDFDGQLPNDYDTLRGLPGFGPYTTAAVLSVAFDKPYPVIEANVRRFLMRILALPGEATFRQDKILLDFLQPRLPRKNFGLFNQALMEFGALVCRNRNPSCLLCPFPDFCLGYRTGKQEVIPPPKKRSTQTIETVIAVFSKGGKYLIQKRPAGGILAGLWEFPGGKREPGESLEAALRREIREELGAEVGRAKFLIQVEHAYTRFQVRLSAFECSLSSEPKLDKNTHRWVSLRSLRHYPFHSGSSKIVNFLEDRARMKA